MKLWGISIFWRPRHLTCGINQISRWLNSKRLFSDIALRLFTALYKNTFRISKGSFYTTSSFIWFKTWSLFAALSSKIPHPFSLCVYMYLKSSWMSTRSMLFLRYIIFIHLQSLSEFVGKAVGDDLKLGAVSVLVKLSESIAVANMDTDKGNEISMFDPWLFLFKGQWIYGPTYCLSIGTHIHSKRYTVVYLWVFLHENQPKSRRISARGNPQRG